MHVLYRINPATQLLMKVDDGKYRTKIIELDNIIHIDQDPLEIIDENCTSSGASLEGRSATVRRILNSNTNLPIPVHVHEGVYLFPTISTSNDNCIWISYFHIFSHEPLGNKSLITFQNGQQIIVDLSYNRLDKQKKRTSEVIAYFYRLGHFPNYCLRKEKQLQ